MTISPHSTRHIWLSWSVLTLATVALTVSPAQAQQEQGETREEVAAKTDAEATRWTRLADRIVNTSAVIKPGDAVIIAGGKHTLPLMEELSIASAKAGGMPMIMLSTDRMERSFFSEVPIEHLAQEPKFFANMIQNADVFIGLPSIEDPQAVFGDIPAERMAKAAEAGEAIEKILDDARIRGVFIGYPTEQLAALNKLQYPAYEKMHWEAIDTDYDAIAKRGQKIQQMLEGAQEIKVTTPAGTNLELAAGDRPIFLDDGIVTEAEAAKDRILYRTAELPGGEVYFAPVENSVEGRVVVPRDRCRYQPLTNVRFDVQNGDIRDFEAAEGAECFKEAMAPHREPRERVAFLSIGLNPARSVMEEGGADYRPGEAAGMVYLGFGGNTLMGGANDTQANFAFPLVGATVEVDGETIVKDGQLMVETETTS